MKAAFLIFIALVLVMINYASASKCKRNEVRMECAPNRSCRTCGTDMCTKECHINACICKEGYRYQDARFKICIPESECP